MSVPSKNFTNIPDGDIDADSPLTETLMTQLRDSLVHLEEWLGVDFVAAKNHDHDGVNSKNIPAGAISPAVQSEGNQVLSGGATWMPASGVYNYAGGGYVYPELYVDSEWRTGSNGMCSFFDGTNMRIANTGGSSRTVYYQKL